MKNADIRKKAKDRNVNLWQIADVLGITDCTMSRKLRYELGEKEKKEIFAIIDDLAKAEQRL